MAKLKRFEIRGLFGSKNVSLNLSDPALILVGPNGMGKSNAASIFYLFVTRQWTRLLDHSFESLVADFGDDEYNLTRQEILGISEVSDILADRRLPTRYRSYISQLESTGELEYFFLKPNLTSIERRHFSSLLGTSSLDVARIQQMFRSRLSVSDELGSTSRGAINRLLKGSIDSRTIYLPTYRRIEKELQQIFPDYEQRVRSADALKNHGAERDDNLFIDLVSFGMEDVKQAVKNRLESLRNYSLAQFNSLSGTYLRDVIRSKATDFKMAQIKTLDGETVDKILDRVSETTLGKQDKTLLKRRVESIRKSKRKRDVELNDRYLIHYFSRLMDVYEDIRSKESDVMDFVRVTNGYLKPSKQMDFDDIGFAISLEDEEANPLDMSHLSSGEKQVVSLFAHLYLDGPTDNIIIIDEPELSLSVPWQTKFLPDILASGRCSFILAVTHSPFIYQNELAPYAVDFRELMTSYE